MLHRNICKSEKLSKISPLAALLYYHLLTLVDDNGNYENDARLIWAHCFPKRQDVGPQEIERCVKELVDVRNGVDEYGLLAEYEAAGHRYLHFVAFEEFQVIPRGTYPKVEHPPHPESLGRVLKDHDKPILPGGWKNRWSHLDSGVLQGDSGSVNVGQGPSEKRSRSRSKEKKGATAAPCAALVYRSEHLQITESEHGKLAEAFPWVDLKAEYRKMTAWIAANPQRRPRKMFRFAYNWASRIAPPKGVTPSREPVRRKELDSRAEEIYRKAAGRPA